MSCKNAIKQRLENRNISVQNPELAVSAALTQSRAEENHNNSLGIQEVVRKNPSHTVTTHSTFLANKTPLDTFFEDTYATAPWHEQLLKGNLLFSYTWITVGC